MIPVIKKEKEDEERRIHHLLCWYPKEIMDIKD
jgi:hypothetical protein